MGFFQKIINVITWKLSYIINDGVADINSPLRGLASISVAKGGKLFIGKNCMIGKNIHIGVLKSVSIMDGATIGPNCLVSDTQHDYRFTNEDRLVNSFQKDCIIHEGASIGFGSVVIGSEIGKNSVVGANSVVINKKIPEGHMFVGDSRLRSELIKFL